VNEGVNEALKIPLEQVLDPSEIPHQPGRLLLDGDESRRQPVSPDDQRVSTSV
jgi:hypothetical protein